jgi:branched-chain amino acid transport system ATP-binding protein
MLEVNNIDVYYGGIYALQSVSLKVEQNEVVAIIGANGSGKTTLIHSIIGFVKPSSGAIKFLGKTINKETIWSRVKLGIGFIPEGGRVFPDLTVKQNLLIGAFMRNDQHIKRDLQVVYDLFPVLKERENQYGKTLSGGEKQIVAIGRALMARPKFMLIDEITMGLMPILVDKIFNIIKYLKDNGITILIAEQNARKVLRIADRAYVFEKGKIVLEGSSNKLIDSDIVKKAYLGG